MQIQWSSPETAEKLQVYVFVHTGCSNYECIHFTHQLLPSYETGRNLEQSLQCHTHWPVQQSQTLTFRKSVFMVSNIGRRAEGGGTDRRAEDAGTGRRAEGGDTDRKAEDAGTGRRAEGGDTGR